MVNRKRTSGSRTMIEQLLRTKLSRSIELGQEILFSLVR